MLGYAGLRPTTPYLMLHRWYVGILCVVHMNTGKWSRGRLLPARLVAWCVRASCCKTAGEEDRVVGRVGRDVEMGRMEIVFSW